MRFTLHTCRRSISTKSHVRHKPCMINGSTSSLHQTRCCRRFSRLTADMQLQLMITLSAYLLLWLGLVAAVHHEGDFIHTARRGQFLRMRTHWHDLIEHHCPRFGQTRLVAIPIHKPGTDQQEVTDYRMQFSFDGDRIITPWLTVIGKGLDGMPLVEVQLRRAGDELQGVRARVLPLPDELLLQHATLYDEFKNDTHWPKHVLVHYHFHNAGDIDFQAGLYVLMTLCMVVFMLLSVNTLAGVQSKVSQFLKEVVGTDYDPLAGPDGGSNGTSAYPQPYVPFKGGSHVE